MSLFFRIKQTDLPKNESRSKLFVIFYHKPTDSTWKLSGCDVLVIYLRMSHDKFLKEVICWQNIRKIPLKQEVIHLMYLNDLKSKEKLKCKYDCDLLNCNLILTLTPQLITLTLLNVDINLKQFVNIVSQITVGVLKLFISQISTEE